MSQNHIKMSQAALSTARRLRWKRVIDVTTYWFHYVPLYWLVLANACEAL